MKKLFVLLLSVVLSLALIVQASADPVSSYAAVQDQLLAAAYKIAPFDVVLSGQIAAIVPSYTFNNAYYLFVLVDPDDVSMWSTEDDNYFVAMVYTDKTPFPFTQGDAITVEGQIISIYSSPVLPYIKTSKINGSEDY